MHQKNHHFDLFFTATCIGKRLLAGRLNEAVWHRNSGFASYFPFLQKQQG
jgi:hypothetical protein